MSSMTGNAVRTGFTTPASARDRSSRVSSSPLSADVALSRLRRKESRDG